MLYAKTLEIKVKDAWKKRQVQLPEMPRNVFRVWAVPRSLISKRVKNPPVLFTRNLFEKG